MPEVISRPFTDGRDEFVSVLLCAYTHDFEVFLCGMVTDSMEQVSFTKSGSSVNVERIEIFAGMFGNFHGSGISKIVRVAYYEVVERVARIKKRELALFGKGMFVTVNDLELKIYFGANDSCKDSFYQRMLVLFKIFGYESIRYTD